MRPSDVAGLGVGANAGLRLQAGANPWKTLKPWWSLRIANCQHQHHSFEGFLALSICWAHVYSRLEMLKNYYSPPRPSSFQSMIKSCYWIKSLALSRHYVRGLRDKFFIVSWREFPARLSPSYPNGNKLGVILWFIIQNIYLIFISGPGFRLLSDESNKGVFCYVKEVIFGKHLRTRPGYQWNQPSD